MEGTELLKCILDKAVQMKYSNNKTQKRMVDMPEKNQATEKLGAL